MAYDRVILRDLGSRNGIRVNGRLVDEVRLQPGDEVALGPILYRFEALVATPGAAGGPGATARPSPRAGGPQAAPGSPGAPGGTGGLLDDADIDLIPLDEL